MVTSRTATSKKTSAKTASSAPAKKTVAAKLATEPKTASKAAVKKAAATPAASKQKAGKAVTTVKNPPRKTEKKITVSPEERYHMIATAAYFLAERHGFNSCYAMKDWITAEAEIDAKLNARG